MIGVASMSEEQGFGSVVTQPQKMVMVLGV